MGPMVVYSIESAFAIAIIVASDLVPGLSSGRMRGELKATLNNEKKRSLWKKHPAKTCLTVFPS
jgi:hypothetical protein